MNEESQSAHCCEDEQLPPAAQVATTTTTATCHQPVIRGRTKLWQEEVLLQAFGHDYDQPKLEDDFYPDDGSHPILRVLPARYLDQWYLFRRRDAPSAANPNNPYEGIWVPRSPLPEEAWMVKEDYVLRGWLRPAPPDAYSYQAPPILIQINHMYLWCVNRRKSYRGYWIHTKTALYWLRDPSSKQGLDRVRITLDDEDTANNNDDDEGEPANNVCIATFPSPSSQEDLHWLQRARVGLVANITDLFSENEEDEDEEETYYGILTPSQLYSELKTVCDEPFDLELLKSEAAFAYSHLNGVIEKEILPKISSEDHPNDYESDDEPQTVFLTSLKKMKSKRVWTTVEYRDSALRAERRSHSINNNFANEQEVASSLKQLPEREVLSNLSEFVHVVGRAVVATNKMDDDDDDDSNYDDGLGSEKKRSAQAKKPQPKRLKRAKVVIESDEDDDSEDDIVFASSSKPRRPAQAAPPAPVARSARQPSQASRTSSISSVPTSSKSGTGNRPEPGRVNGATGNGSPRQLSTKQITIPKKSLKLSSILTAVSGGVSMPPSTTTNSSRAAATATVPIQSSAKLERMEEILRRKGLRPNSSQSFSQGSTPQHGSGVSSIGNVHATGGSSFRDGPAPCQTVVDLTDDDVVDLTDAKPMARRDNATEDLKPEAKPRVGYGGFPERCQSNSLNESKAYRKPPPRPDFPPKPDFRSNSYRQTEPHGVPPMVTPPEQMFARRHSSSGESQPAQGSGVHGNTYERRQSCWRLRETG